MTLDKLAELTRLVLLTYISQMIENHELGRQTKQWEPHSLEAEKKKRLRQLAQAWPTDGVVLRSSLRVYLGALSYFEMDLDASLPHYAQHIQVITFSELPMSHVSLVYDAFPCSTVLYHPLLFLGLDIGQLENRVSGSCACKSLRK